MRKQKEEKTEPKSFQKDSSSSMKIYTRSYCTKKEKEEEKQTKKKVFKTETHRQSSGEKGER